MELAKIRVFTYLEKVVSTLSEEGRDALLQCINGTDNTNEQVSYDNLPDYEVGGVYFQFKDRLATGILINSEDYLVLLEYGINEHMNIIDLGLETHNPTIINQSLSVEELKRTLIDISESQGSGITAPQLHQILVGSDDISADLNDAGTKVVVKLDEDVKDKIDMIPDSKTDLANLGGLVVPTATLTNGEIVGVGVSKEQTRIQLGTGLKLTGTTSPFTLDLDLDNYDGREF